jgi:hypothetical protein
VPEFFSSELVFIFSLVLLLAPIVYKRRFSRDRG